MALARIEREERSVAIDQVKAKWAPVWQALYDECKVATGHCIQDFEETYLYCESCGYSEMIGDRNESA